MFSRTIIIFSIAQTCAFATTGNLFSLTASGTAAELNITLCLNVNNTQPFSCQNYIVHNTTLSILTTIPNHTYPFAGIRINTPGYQISNSQTTSAPARGFTFTGPLNSTNATSIVISSPTTATPMIAAGTYLNTNTVQFPLIATSTNNGLGWSTTLDSATSSALPSDYLYSGIFNGAMCSELTCVAVGIYKNPSNYQYPYIATSTNGGLIWSATLDSLTTTALPNDITTTNPNTGSLNTVTCNGSNCIAAGQYLSSDNLTYPYIATSTDNGISWIPTLDSSTNSSLPTNYQQNGVFNSVTCTNNNCIAVGNYYSTSNIQYPLITTSTNSGLTWETTLDYTLLPSNYIRGGQFNSVTCSNTNCVAVGMYTKSELKGYPLIATSVNSGLSWTYTLDDSMPATAPSGYFNNGKFSDVACTGSHCVAVGSYQSKIGNTPFNFPLIASSNNSGQSWTYTLDRSTSSELPSDFSKSSVFTNAACTNSNCIAVGNYKNTSNIIYPLIVTSTNQGLTWSPTLDSLTTTALPSDYYNNSQLYSISCSDSNCSSVGLYSSLNAQYPYIVTSIDAGITWTTTLNGTTSSELPNDYSDQGKFLSN